jgi:type II secretory pathway pseudopilin PulG
MRGLLLILALATMVSAGMVAQQAAAAEATLGAAANAALSQQDAQVSDDDRVEVQLVVLGVAVGFVVVFGSLAYLVRRRLGLVAPPPDPREGGHDAH